MRRMLGLILCALTLLATACSTPPHVRVAAPAPRLPYGAAIPGVPNSLGHGRHNDKITIDGIQRYYSVQVPKGLTTASSVPVIVALHGLAETYLNIESYSGLDAAAQKLGAVVIYPNGLKGSWDAGTCCGYAAANKIDDVAFISAILAQAHQDFNVSHSFILGFSNGGMLAYRFLCEHPTEISGIGVASATDVFTSPDGKQSLCKPAHAADVIDIQGLADRRIPLHGGYNPYLGTPLMDVDDAMASVSTDDCKALPKTSTPTSVITIYDGVGCAAGAERLVTVKGLGHKWASSGLDATSTLLTWLIAHADAASAVKL